MLPSFLPGIDLVYVLQRLSMRMARVQIPQPKSPKLLQTMLKVARLSVGCRLCALSSHIVLKRGIALYRRLTRALRVGGEVAIGLRTPKSQGRCVSGEDGHSPA